MCNFALKPVWKKLCGTQIHDELSVTCIQAVCLHTLRPSSWKSMTLTVGSETLPNWCFVHFNFDAAVFHNPPLLPRLLISLCLDTLSTFHLLFFMSLPLPQPVPIYLFSCSHLLCVEFREMINPLCPLIACLPDYNHSLMRLPLMLKWSLDLQHVFVCCNNEAGSDKSQVSLKCIKDSKMSAGPEWRREREVGGEIKVLNVIYQKVLVLQETLLAGGRTSRRMNDGWRVGSRFSWTVQG